MKTLYTIIFLGLSTLLVGQYDNILVGNRTGIALGNATTGDGVFYTIDVQKHLGKGIYGILSYESGQLEEGMDYESESPGFVDYQSDLMTQYRSVGLGLKKELRVSPEGRVGFAFSGLYFNQSRVEWDVFTDAFNNVILSDSQERYGRRNDFGYSLSVEYTVRINHFIRLGGFAGYVSEPSLFISGLRLSAVLGTKTVKETNASTPDIKKNWIEVRFGSVGSDGVSPVPIYTLEYGRKLGKRFSGYAKYSMAKGFSDRDLNRILADFNDEDRVRFDNLFLIEDHEGAGEIFHPTLSRSISVGLRLALNRSDKSSLSVSGGLGWFTSEVVRLSSNGFTLDFYRESYVRFDEFLPEVGLHYDYLISEQFYLGGKVDLAFRRFNFGAGVHVGMRF